MNNPLGIVLAVVVVVAAGGGVYMWHEHQQLAQARRDLDETKSALDQATAQMRSAQADTAGARKELDEQKIALDQLKREHDAAVVFLDAEKAHSARLQAELTTAREQVAALRSRSSPYGQPPVARPTLAPQPLPTPVLGNRGSSRGAARAARGPAIEAEQPQ